MSKYNFSARKLIFLLRENHFYFVKQRGSHAFFKNFENGKKVIVPIHTKDIPKGTAKAILNDADIKI